MHESATTKNVRGGNQIFETLRDVLPVLVVATAIISSWAYFKFSITSLEKRTDSIESLQKSQTASVGQIFGELKGVNDRLDLIINGKIVR